MKTDYLHKWREHVTKCSPRWLKTLLPAVILLTAAGTANANLVTDGDFGTTGSCAAGPVANSNFDPGSPNLNTWMGIDKWSIKNDDALDGNATNCYASFDVLNTASYNRGRLIQGFNAPAETGIYSVSYRYVYEDGTDNAAGPYFWVLGVNSGDAEISRSSTNEDGFPPPEIVDWDVLYQKKLAGDCNLTDCENGPSVPVGPAGTPVNVSDTFHVPAAYDYWVVVVTYGCSGAHAPTADCENTLRGLDDVSITVLEADELGPVTTYIEFTPNAAVVNLPFIVTAIVRDTGTGNSNIESAEYRILESGGGVFVDWTYMNALDGAFDSPLELVTAEAGGLPVGTYDVCVRGTDAGNNTGEEDCSQLVVYHPISESGGLNIPISNECAQFYTLENEGAENEITTLHYGETIIFDTDVRIDLKLNISGSGNVNFNFSTKANGQGTGATSGILYNFMLNSVLRAKTDLSDFDPSTFTFNVRAKIVGQAQEIDGHGILNGAQNNAELFFKVRLHYANGRFTHETYDYGVECVGDPWSNLMENKDLETRMPVGRGFGKETNKYGWAGADFKDGLIVATKNAWYDIVTYIGGDGNPYPPGIDWCIDNPPDLGTSEYPEVYWRFACMEIYGNSQHRTSDGAEIWRFDYKKKRWQNVYDAAGEELPGDDEVNSPPGTPPEYIQGFRDAVVHDGKLYVAGDRGAFISGVSYETPGYFPGVAILVSEDGINFEELDCPPGLCGGATPPIPANNGSIRALASYGDRLMIGTFNNLGGEVWSYDGSGNASGFHLENKFDQKYPIVGELEPYDGKLYVGLGGALTVDDGANNDYLWVCEACTDAADDFATVPDLPDIDPNSLFVIKLFVALDKMFVGTVNFENGFSFLSYDADSDVWDVIVDGPGDGGMFDPFNIYLWSGTGPINGRIFIGTFNPATITEIPRGTAELWYSDDGVNWTQYPMPIGWSLLNYGIRNMVVGDKGRSLFLLSASNMLAPDVVDIDNPLQAGTEVWSIRDTKVASPSGGTKKGKGRNK